MLRNTMLIMIASVLVGCATQQGNFETRNMTNYMKIDIGESTRVEVHEHFSQPTDILENEIGTAWIYANIDREIHGSTFVPIIGLFTGGAVLKGEITTFQFDRKGVLQDVKNENYNEYVNTWEEGAMSTAKSVTGDYRDVVQRVELEMLTFGFPFDEKAAADTANYETMIDSL